MSCCIAGSNNEHNDPYAAPGGPDSNYVSLGVAGWIALDLGEGREITDGDGSDFKIHQPPEGSLLGPVNGKTGSWTSLEDEGITVYAGNDTTGPWAELGSGRGTCEFDLDASGLNFARYVKIADDGDGNSLSTSPGYNLDAIENLSPSTDVYTENQDESLLPQFSLKQNYPNPFNPSTRIEFTLRTPGFVRLEVYNLLGRRVRTLVSEHLAPGYESLVWDGKDDEGAGVASGIYFYRLETPGFSQTKKMLFLK